MITQFIRAISRTASRCEGADFGNTCPMKSRMQRLLARDGKCFDVAVDHGFFGEASFLNGIENMEQALETLIAAAPDAIQLTLGQAHWLQTVGGPKPALVLRSDVANVYGRELPDTLFSQLIGEPVESALRLDAACLVVNLFQIPNRPEVTRDCIQNITRLQPKCERFGMPLMIEPLVFRPNAQSGGYMVDGDVEKIVPLVRQAVELGADVIKADPTDQPQQFTKVIQTAGGVPVLVRGGGKTSERELLERTHALLQTGARGIVYGRNIIQHSRPKNITRALMALLHDGASVESALQVLAGGEV